MEKSCYLNPRNVLLSTGTLFEPQEKLWPEKTQGHLYLDPAWRITYKDQETQKAQQGRNPIIQLVILLSSTLPLPCENQAPWR